MNRTIFSNFIIIFFYSLLYIDKIVLCCFILWRQSYELFDILSYSHGVLHKNLASFLFCNFNLLIK